MLLNVENANETFDFVLNVGRFGVVGYMERCGSIRRCGVGTFGYFLPSIKVGRNRNNFVAKIVYQKSLYRKYSRKLTHIL